MILDVIQSVFLQHGFKKRKACFFIPRGELVAAACLQKSSYGEAWYLNVGFIVSTYSPELKIVAGNLNVRTRAELMNLGDTRYFEALLNLDRPLGDLDREREIRIYLQKYVMPVLIETTNFDELKGLLKSPVGSVFVRDRRAYEMFNCE